MSTTRVLQTDDDYVKHVLLSRREGSRRSGHGEQGNSWLARFGLGSNGTTRLTVPKTVGASAAVVTESNGGGDDDTDEGGGGRD
jgi:hypothetical protein